MAPDTERKIRPTRPSFGEHVKRVIQSDLVVTLILFSIFALLSFNIALLAQAVPRIERNTEHAVEVSVQAAREAASFANLIRDCQTPGTECYNFRQEEEQKELRQAQERADAQVARLTSGQKCIIEALIYSPPPGSERIARQDEIRAGYDACINALSPVVPPPAGDRP